MNGTENPTEPGAVQADANVPLSNRRDWKYHAQRINAAWSKRAEGAIETGQALIDARGELEKQTFRSLVESNDLPFNHATVFKLIAIAQCQILVSHGKQLPESWTTLYELTRLPAALLRAKLNDGSITPKLERKDVARWRKGERGTTTVDGRAVEHRPSLAEQLKAAKTEITQLKNTCAGSEHLFDPNKTSDREIAETMIGRLEGWRGRAARVAKLMLEILDQEKSKKGKA